MDSNKKLEVRDLVVSFRTVNGKVQAVRDISFDLYKEDTLAIVGESGSGKSVTSKAILGILAGNAIIEGGEIIYDGRNLLSIPEDEFHKIRGDKIAMIFQDPLSSLNPIMRIGNQLTEAMLLKGKARQKESRITFNNYLSLLSDNMVASINDIPSDELKAKCKNFDKFEYKHLELENAYNVAYGAAEEAIEDIEAILFELSKNAYNDVKYRLHKIAKCVESSIHEYVVKGHDDEIASLTKELKGIAGKVKSDEEAKTRACEILNKLDEMLKEAVAYTMPNFFSMGYYLTFSGQPLPELSVEELNVFLRKYLDDNFMLDFIKCTKQALIYSANVSYERKEAVVEMCEEYIEYFTNAADLDKAECDSIYEKLTSAVKESIDKLEIVKDGLAYTFDSSLKAQINTYFDGVKKNVKEQKRFDKDTAKYNKLVEKGKEPDWKVVPLALVDLDICKEGIISQITRLKEDYEEQIAKKESRDFDEEAVGVIDFLKENASGVVAKITPAMAKAKAIKLMEEVGIPEPRKRYRQYPFEFSGGMRQRIVIAIALAANPDILICDEPTTALDVTIQAQILELINDLKKKRKLAVIFITHDLGVVANMADRIAVMYAGKIVEYGTAEDIFYSPAHPYTWALLSSMPDLDTNEKLDAIPGTPPNMIYPPKGDAFADRNKYALKIDFEEQPPMFKISDSHYAATWLLHPNAPKIPVPEVVTARIERMKKLNAENAAKMAEAKPEEGGEE